MNSLCIIPARGGSKRIPRKNIRSFHGRPIIAYSIEAALKSNCFAEVMVSTDDEETATIARECGAAVPFLRSGQTAGDYAGVDDVAREVIGRYRNEANRVFPHVCLLLATAPLVTAFHLEQGYARLLADPSLSAVLPVVSFSFPIQRALVRRNGRVPLLQPEHYHTRSQDLEKTYHDAGQWYWMNTERFLVTGEMMGPNCDGVPLPSTEAQDIDNEDDWAMAELKFHMAQKRRTS